MMMRVQKVHERTTSREQFKAAGTRYVDETNCETMTCNLQNEHRHAFCVHRMS